MSPATDECELFLTRALVTGRACQLHWKEEEGGGRALFALCREDEWGVSRAFE